MTEVAPVKGEDGEGLRTANGELVKYPQPIKKPAKVTIGSWHDAQPGAAATTERFEKQLRRILTAAREYGLDQGADNLGVAIITVRSTFSSQSLRSYRSGNRSNSCRIASRTPAFAVSRLDFRLTLSS